MDTTTKNLPMHRPGQRMDAEERLRAQDRFLEVYAATGYRGQACEAAGVIISTLTRWRKDPAFKVRFLEAEEVANDSLRDELEKVRRDGLRNERWERDEAGEMVLVEREMKQDARVIMGTAQARLPEFRPAQKVELSGVDGQPIQMVEITPEEARETLRLLRGARQLGLLQEPTEGEYKEIDPAS